MIKIGERAPEFSTTTESGDTVSLSELLLQDVKPVRGGTACLDKKTKHYRQVY